MKYSFFILYFFQMCIPEVFVKLAPNSPGLARDVRFEGGVPTAATAAAAAAAASEWSRWEGLFIDVEDGVIVVVVFENDEREVLVSWGTSGEGSCKAAADKREE